MTFDSSIILVLRVGKTKYLRFFTLAHIFQGKTKRRQKVRARRSRRHRGRTRARSHFARPTRTSAQATLRWRLASKRRRRCGYRVFSQPSLTRRLRAFDMSTGSCPSRHFSRLHSCPTRKSICFCGIKIICYTYGPIPGNMRRFTTTQ